MDIYTKFEAQHSLDIQFSNSTSLLVIDDDLIGKLFKLFKNKHFIGIIHIR